MEVPEWTAASADARTDRAALLAKRVKAHRCRDVRNRLKPYAPVRGC
jgi:hypothetical protein